MLEKKPKKFKEVKLADETVEASGGAVKNMLMDSRIAPIKNESMNAKLRECRIEIASERSGARHWWSGVFS